MNDDDFESKMRGLRNLSQGIYPSKVSVTGGLEADLLSIRQIAAEALEVSVKMHYELKNLRRERGIDG